MRIFDENFATIDGTEIVFVLNPIAFDFSDASVKKGLLKKLKAHWAMLDDSPMLEQEYGNFISHFYQCINDIFDINLNIINDLSIEALFKMVKLEISTDDINSTFEMAELILDFCLDIGDPKLVIFCNLDNYLSEEQYTSLIEVLTLNQQTVLFLENTWQKKMAVNGWTLDEDFEVFKL